VREKHYTMSGKCHILGRKNQRAHQVQSVQISLGNAASSSALLQCLCVAHRGECGHQGRNESARTITRFGAMLCRAEQSKWTTNWSRKLRTEEVVFGSRTGSWTGDLLFWAWAASSSIAVDGPEGPCSSYLLPPSVLSILGPWQGWMGRMAAPQHSLSRLQCRRSFRCSPPPPLAQPAPSSEPPSGTSARQGIPLRPTPWSHSYLHRFVPPQ